MPPKGKPKPHVRRPFGAWLLVASLAMALPACQTPRWPLEGAVRSPFGLRMNGVSPDVHRGVDIAAQIGTPVRPLLSGRVRFAGTMSGFGSVIWVDHNDNLLSVYAHLSEINVREGDSIEQNQVLGLTGISGNAQGPHLHLEVWRWGREVDPVTFLGGPPT